MAKSNTFYAIRHGRRPGICDSKVEFDKRINGFPNAEGKKCTTKEEALAYLGIRNEKECWKLEMESTRFLSKLNDTIAIYVDGSYLPSHSVYGGAFVAIKDNQKIDEGYKPGVSEEAATSLNSLAGELNGAMLGVQYATKNGYKNTWIHYDNENIARFGLNECKPQNPLIKQYVKYLNSARKKYGISIDFLKVKAHSGNKWNEEADKLAKKAASEAKELRTSYQSEKQNKVTLRQITSFSTSNKNVPSHVESYQMLQRGKTITDIANERGFLASTIFGHIAKCHLEGLPVNFDNLCNEELELLVIPLLKKHGLHVPTIRSRLSIDTLYGEILLIGAKHGYAENR